MAMGFHGEVEKSTRRRPVPRSVLLVLGLLVVPCFLEGQVVRNVLAESTGPQPRILGGTLRWTVLPGPAAGAGDDAVVEQPEMLKVFVEATLAVEGPGTCRWVASWLCESGCRRPLVKARGGGPVSASRPGGALSVSSFTLSVCASCEACTLRYESLCRAEGVAGEPVMMGQSQAGGMVMHLDLRGRGDTGRPNSPPWAAFPLLLRIGERCHRGPLCLSTWDEDGDRVRCRFATRDECGSCDAVPGLALNEETCELTFGGSLRADPATFFVLVMVEDFPASSVGPVGPAKNSAQPLSSVPLQFTLIVSPADEDCSSREPAFTAPTPGHGAVFQVDAGTELELSVDFLVSRDPQGRQPPAALLVAHGGSRVGAVTSDPATPGLQHSTLRWSQPAEEEEEDRRTPRRICFYAEDFAGRRSEVRCLTAVVSGAANRSRRHEAATLPRELQATGFTVESALCNADTVQFTVTFNQKFSATSVAAYVRLLELRSGQEALALDARDAGAVRALAGARAVAFAAPPFSLRGGVRYCVTLDEGVAQLDADGARINSQPHAACDWTFALPRRVYASCYAQCDPHFKSFDGRLFDYMGTKPVLLAGTCQPTGTGPSWAVYGKSEHWGSRVVSWMEAVVVEVYGYRVTLEHGYVKVNGAFVNVPYAEPDFKFKVYSSNHYFVLRTNLHFSVKFGGSRVVVELENSALYQGTLCGLCGNYNGDPRDDWKLPGQGAMLNAHDFGNYWISSSIRMSGVPDDGSSDQQPLNETRVAAASQRQKCGLLLDSRGPLASCNGTVNPLAYFSDCVYDMATEDALKTYVALCLALQAYSDDCYAAGAPVSPAWRTVTGCELSCGPMPVSVLSTAASACPATCADPDAGLDCGDPVVEDCVCAPGHLWDRTRCVEPARCGCVIDGKYYSIDEKFYNEDCSHYCKCVGRELAYCDEASCQLPLQHCGVNEYGTHGCLHRWLICSSGGSQHYATFDGRAYEFFGTYTYTLAMTRDSASDSSWRVLLKNSPVTGSFIQSQPKAVIVEIAGLTVTFLSRKRVLVNGRSAKIPFYHPSGDHPEVVLTYAGNHLLLEGSVGLRVLFDGQQRHVLVAALASHAGLVSGLCGDLDGDPANDLRLPNGTAAGSPGAFGDSWRVSLPWDSGFEQGLATDPVTASQDPAWRPLSCGRLLDPLLFGPCHGELAVHPFWQRCVWQVSRAARNHAADAALCAALELYAAACALHSVALPDWRAKVGCALPRCPPGSHYEACAPSCPSTCAVPTADGLCPVRLPCLGGCVCNFGRVWSGDRCVSPADCGCVAGNAYYQVGSLFLSKNCTELCSCRAGAVTCSAFRCPGECLLEEGEYLCPKRIRRCLVSGDSHYTTFDGSVLDVHGTCNYTLMSVAQRPDVLVLARHERRARGTTVTLGVSVRVQATTVALERGSRVYLNGVRKNLPLLHMPFFVFENARDIVVLSYDLDFLVRYDGWASLSIEVGPGLAGATTGLCGNNDGRPDDGAAGPAAFASSSLVPPVDDSATCDPATPPASAWLPLAAAAAAAAACAALSDAAGPFAACHGAVPPAWWAGTCAVDSAAAAAAGGDGRAARCRLMHTYHTLCRQQRVFVAKWRGAAGCDVACPADSRPESCTSLCPPSCAMPSSDCEWPCVSGCQCRRGFFLHGGSCVPLEGCGCFDGSSYYEVGQQFRGSDCSTLYTCHGNRSLTRNHDACMPGYTCQLRDGAYGCVPPDYTMVECHHERMMVLISKRLVLGQDVSALSLIAPGPGCALRDAGAFISFNVSLRECGTIFKETEDFFVFKQTVTLRNISDNMITYDWLLVFINAICKIPRTKLLNQDPFSINTTGVRLRQVAYGDLDLRMDLFPSKDFARRYEPGEYPVAVRFGQPLFMQVSIRTGLRLAVFTVDCFATPGSSPLDPNKAYLVRNGCLEMDTVNLTLSHSVRRFSFKAFGFANSRLLYVHCSVIVCGRSSATSRCHRGCHAQRRRKAAVGDSGTDEAAVFVLTRGPFAAPRDAEAVEAVEAEAPDNSYQRSFVAVVILASLLVFLFLLGCSLCVIGTLLNDDNERPADIPLGSSD